jgi:putative DNA primase/helicase
MIVSKFPYLQKKKIRKDCARLYRNALVIPIFDEFLKLVNLQFIDANGTKRFLTGGQKKGCFSYIGDLDKNEKILICEGFATGASLHENTGLLVLIALDAGNLEPVALAARRRFRQAEIVIAGDNDVSGVGQEKATKAALAVDGKYLIPPVPGTDWNDFLTAEGAGGLCVMI